MNVIDILSQMNTQGIPSKYCIRYIIIRFNSTMESNYNHRALKLISRVASKEKLFYPSRYTYT